VAGPVSTWQFRENQADRFGPIGRITMFHK
jgi:hypothetical protein